MANRSGEHPTGATLRPDWNATRKGGPKLVSRVKLQLGEDAREVTLAGAASV
jgi:hypothetical protein